MQCWEN